MKEIPQFIITFFILNATLSIAVMAQTELSKSELSLNGFRTPSIGAEYRYRLVPIHAGYYTTAFESGYIQTL